MFSCFHMHLRSGKTAVYRDKSEKCKVSKSYKSHMSDLDDSSLSESSSSDYSDLRPLTGGRKKSHFGGKRSKPEVADLLGDMELINQPGTVSNMNGANGTAMGAQTQVAMYRGQNGNMTMTDSQGTVYWTGNNGPNPYAMYNQPMTYGPNQPIQVWPSGGYQQMPMPMQNQPMAPGMYMINGPQQVSQMPFQPYAPMHPYHMQPYSMQPPNMNATFTQTPMITANPSLQQGGIGNNCNPIWQNMQQQQGTMQNVGGVVYSAPAMPNTQQPPQLQPQPQPTQEPPPQAPPQTPPQPQQQPLQTAQGPTTQHIQHNTNTQQVGPKIEGEIQMQKGETSEQFNKRVSQFLESKGQVP